MAFSVNPTILGCERNMTSCFEDPEEDGWLEFSYRGIGWFWFQDKDYKSTTLTIEEYPLVLRYFLQTFRDEKRVCY